MLKTKAKTNGGSDFIIKRSRSDIVDMLETRARKRLGISAKQLLKKYRTGKLDDVGEVADLIVLSGLLPDNDPIFG